MPRGGTGLPCIGRLPKPNSASKNETLRGARAPLTCRHRLLLALALLHWLDHAALALDRRKRAAVDIVDVAADLQLAGIIDERVLIGQQDPDLRRQLNILLARAEHPLDP